jgi:hypothetical protein
LREFIQIGPKSGKVTIRYVVRRMGVPDEGGKEAEEGRRTANKLISL